MTKLSAYTVGLLGVIIGACLPSHFVEPLRVSAQSATADWAKSVPGKMSFEVASVKQDIEEPTAANFHSNVPLDAGDDFVPTGGLFSASNQWFTQYLVFA